MRLHRIVIPVLLFAVLASSSTAFAQEGIKASIHAFWESVKRDTKRNHAWPKPFAQQSRITARAPFNVMVANGWRYENMLGDHHFDPETGELNAAGKFRIGRILTENPIQHRSIYVHRAADSEQMTKRMQSVQTLAAEYATDGKMPPIYETTEGPVLMSAEQDYLVRQAAEQMREAPKLPEATYISP